MRNHLFSVWLKVQRQGDQQTYQEPQVETSEKCGDTMFSLLHEALVGKKTNSGREQSREESRLEGCQYLGSTAKMGFVQDPHQVSTNSYEAALLQSTAPSTWGDWLYCQFLHHVITSSNVVFINMLAIVWRTNHSYSKELTAHK